MMRKNAVYLGETKTLTKTDLYISCQTISNRDSSKMVFKTLRKEGEAVGIKKEIAKEPRRKLFHNKQHKPELD